MEEKTIISGAYASDSNFVTVFEEEEHKVYTLCQSVEDWGARELGHDLFYAIRDQYELTGDGIFVVSTTGEWQRVD